jgi:rfaE bifunctional protein nucleotidyltransferase chain/domain
MTMKKQPDIIMAISPLKIKRLMENIRKKNDKIIFTNGVFDIIHYGHVDYLSRAKKMGDILIVGVNSDGSVKKFKSKGRPLQNEKDRIRILAALKCVDYVIRFTEETPERLIKLIKPDILVKGADYGPNEIAGAEFVKSYGGKVRRIRLLKGRSTTNIIAKIMRLSNSPGRCRDQYD